MSKQVDEFVNKIFPKYIEEKKKEDGFFEEFEPYIKEIFTDGVKALYRYNKINNNGNRKHSKRSNKQTTNYKTWLWNF